MTTLIPVRLRSQRYFSIILGLFVGAACSRLWLDFFAPPLPLWTVAGIFLVAFWIGLKWPGPRWTLCGLLIYCARPVPLASLAVWVVALAVVGAITHLTVLEKRRSLALFDLLPAIAALLVFVLTLAPGLLPADGGEFQVVAATWGIAHPPGYALYTILAGTIAHLLPFGTPAWRVNLLSAITGAATVLIVSRIVRRETSRVWAGWLAGLTLMVAVSFWMTSTQASIRPLTAFFEALMIEAVLAYRSAQREGRSTTSPLIRFGLAVGLGVTHHGSLIFTALVLALALVLVNLRAWRRWTIAIAAGLVGLLPWLYLLIRADGFLAPADLRSWNGFLNHVLARGFAGDMFAYAAPSYWAERWQVMVEVFRLQWQPWIIPLALIGLLLAFLRSRWLGGTLIAVLLVHSVVVGTYRAPQTVEYALPAYVVIAIAVGYAVQFTYGAQDEKAATVGIIRQMSATSIRQALSIFLGTAVLAGIVLGFNTGWLTMSRFAAIEEAREAAIATLAAAPPNAVVLAHWHRATPLWYMQQVEGFRRDVAVQYVYPQGTATPQETWAKAIQENVSQGRQVVFLQDYPEAYRALPYTLESQPEGYLALPTLPPLPPNYRGIPFGPSVLLTDWKWLPKSLNPKGDLTSGQTARLQITWYLTAPVAYGDLTTFVHLGGVDQPPIAQLDLPMQAPALDPQTQTGAVTVIYDVFIPATVSPGMWSIFAGAYTPQGPLLSNGQQRIRLGSVGIDPSLFPMPTQHPVSGGLSILHLRGWDYDNSVPGTTLLYLHWEMPFPFASTVSVSVEEHTITVTIGDQPIEQPMSGYWTSVSTLSSALAQEPLQVRVLSIEDSADIGFEIPAARGDEHYVPFGDIGVLVGWGITATADRLSTRLDWLASAASYDDMTIQVSASGDGWSQAGDFSPVAGSIPTLKWAFGSHISSQQTLILNQTGTVKRIKVLLYNSASSRSVFIWDTRLTTNGPGLQIWP